MITFFDRNPILCSAWNVYLKDVGFPYQIKQCNFLDLEQHEYLVNAGNSFGLMDGGIDYYISEYWKKENPETWNNYLDEIKNYIPLPLGLSKIFWAGTNIFNFLCQTPTMIWPQDISETYNVFYATLGAISELNLKEWKENLAICGLGTGCGNVSPIDCAKQMNAAFKYYNSVKNGGWDDVALLKQILGEI